MLRMSHLQGFNVKRAGASFGWYALAYKATDTMTSVSSGEQTFDGEISDVANIHSTVTESSKLIIPAAWDGRYGIVKFGAESASSDMGLWPLKNASTFAGGGRLDSATGGNQFNTITSAPVLLTTGDEFEAHFDLSAAVGLNTNEHTWFSIELMPSTFDGALAAMGSAQALSAGTFTALQFGGTDTYDANARHDPVTNNTRMNTISGDELVILYGGIESSTTSAGQLVMDMQMSVGGGAAASFFGQPRCDAESSGQDFLCCQSAVISVANPGTDYFVLQGFHTAATNINATAHTYFGIRKLPSDTEYILLQLTADEDVGTDVNTTIVWDSVVANTGPFTHSGAYVVIDEDGWYEISANLTFVSASGQSSGRLQLDDADFYGMAERDSDTAGTDAVNMVSAPVYLTNGQQVSVKGYQVAGGDVDAGDFTWFCVRKIVPPTS